jgi:PEP-CTERM motif
VLPTKRRHRLTSELNSALCCLVPLNSCSYGSHALRRVIRFVLPPVLAFFSLGAGLLPARANTIFDVSATMFGALPYATCSPSCTLGGTITINTTTGVIDAVDVTMSGEIPMPVGPFTNIVSVTKVSEVNLYADDTLSDQIQIEFLGIDSLIGYTGGALDPIYVIGYAYPTQNGPYPEWFLSSTGQISPAQTPLPPSWTMMLLGLAGLGFAGYRRMNKQSATAAA